ncbi:putative rapid response to glucose protein [Rosellinia necatrix]|uniref:Putative rapid response to glucose protein n=1 Tax=Rosellinia necatrix TaxID=77044 RepID=A0A1S7ULW1_ROSNE|nr:putative rapid response to glucose protein [Rosellinia necatrix]
MPMTAGDVSADDFPQLWERPSFEALLTCLGHLHIEPPIWNAAVSGTAPRENRAKSARHHREVILYLAGIVSNGLRWIEDDDQKEVIWEAASRCLSQRCGRAGMGEVTRTWPFQGRQVPFELIIREPPITGDSLGHKTWGSSFLMAQLLDSFAFEYLAHLLTPGGRESLSVLELGSGTGLLGIAAAAMWQAEVVLSDLPDIMPNLVYNIEQNRDTVEHLGGKVHSGILTWGSKIGNDTRFSCENNFDIILAADGIYDDEHPILLSSAIHTQLRDNPNSRAIVMAPIRDEVTKNLIAQFRSNMETGTLSLEVLAEQTLTGQDDWGDGDDSQLVECWWAVFGKQST